MKRKPEIPDFSKFTVPYDVSLGPATYAGYDITHKEQLKEQAELALKLITENRFFEIKMYWVRSAYFIAVIGAILTGFVSISDDILRILLVFAGYFCSWVWFLSSKGSKFWHENWEYHAEEMQKLLGIHLYERTIVDICYLWNGTTWDPRTWILAERFSVSKLNACLALGSILFWVVLTAYLFAILNITWYWMGADIILLTIIPAALIKTTYYPCRPKDFSRLADSSKAIYKPRK